LPSREEFNQLREFNHKILVGVFVCVCVFGVSNL
jgi:hypothetical protein